MLDFKKQKEPRLSSELITKVMETEQGNNQSTPTGGASEAGQALSIDELG